MFTQKLIVICTIPTAAITGNPSGCTTVTGDSTNPGNSREFERSYFCNCRSNKTINEVKPLDTYQLWPKLHPWYCRSSDVHEPVDTCIFTFAGIPFHWFYRPKLVLYSSCLFPSPRLLRCIYRHSRQRTNSRFHNAEHCGCLEITFTLRLTSLTKHLACFVGTDVKISDTDCRPPLFLVFSPQMSWQKRIALFPFPFKSTVLI